MMSQRSTCSRTRLAFAGVSAALFMSGCTTSEKSLFEDHLNLTIAQGPAAQDDVAIAFHLDEHRLETLASVEP